MKLLFDSIFGRFLVAHERITFATGLEIARARAKNYLIPQTPTCIIEFDDLSVEELDLEVAAQKAAHNLDTKRWFEGIEPKKAFLLTLGRGQRFIYVADIVDCWRSFLFIDEEVPTKKDTSDT